MSIWNKIKNLKNRKTKKVEILIQVEKQLLMNKI